jgi:hypothetical protein
MGFDLKYVNIPFVIDDVSTAGQVYIPINEETAGTIVEVETVLNGAIITADADLTPKINGTAITGGLITIATAASAAGDIDNSAPTALNEVVDGDLLEIETDGASGNAVRVFGNVLIRR